MPEKKVRSRKGLPMVGIFLILLGIIGIFDQYFPGLELWPLILVGIGVAMVIEKRD